MEPHPRPLVTRFTLSLPRWAVAENRLLPEVMAKPEDRMAAVLRFARRNVEERTGGPFAAGVFERDSGRPLVIGVNRVMASGVSSAHAEVMALALAQKRWGTWDLAAAGRPDLELVVNWRPCVLCLGALLWSGVRGLVIAGSGPELEEITGFDEGPVHPEWRHELERRGLRVTEGLLRDQALQGFRDFAASGAPVYNARRPAPRSSGPPPNPRP